MMNSRTDKSDGNQKVVWRVDWEVQRGTFQSDGKSSLSCFGDGYMGFYDCQNSLN